MLAWGTAAVIKGKIRVWHYTEGRWNAKRACEMYKRALAPAMRKAFPGKKKFKILEDNDPAGYKTKAAFIVKKEIGVEEIRLPKRSPDLNVLDYCLWHEINTRMRVQERMFKPDFKEKEDAYKKRLRRTALGLPKSLVKRAVGDIVRRLALIKKAKGGLIAE